MKQVSNKLMLGLALFAMVSTSVVAMPKESGKKASTLSGKKRKAADAPVVNNDNSSTSSNDSVEIVATPVVQEDIKQDDTAAENSNNVSNDNVPAVNPEEVVVAPSSLEARLKAEAAHYENIAQGLKNQAEQLRQARASDQATAAERMRLESKVLVTLLAAQVGRNAGDAVLTTANVIDLGGQCVLRNIYDFSVAAPSMKDAVSNWFMGYVDYFKSFKRPRLN